MTESPSPKREPTLVLGPLALVAVVGFWRALRRRSLPAFMVGAGAAAAEFGWPDYQRVKRRFSLVSHIPDD